MAYTPEETAGVRADIEKMELGEIGDKISTTGFLLGISSGWDEVAELFTKKSGEAYAKRDDALARFYREAADLIKKEQKDKRKRYDESQPYRDLLFERLEEQQKHIKHLEENQATEAL